MIDRFSCYSFICYQVQFLAFNYQIFPLGDSAATIDLSDHIGEEFNRKVLHMQQWFLENSVEGVKDLIVGYSSLSVFYDPVLIRKKYPHSGNSYQFIKTKLEEAWSLSSYPEGEPIHAKQSIPVCYDLEFGIDLNVISRLNNLTVEEIIQLHTDKVYRVYMIGFLPGFSYLGQLDERLVIPRKLKPVPVPAGSVAIAGSQTGIYSLNCPGGWQIIGRTPIKLFDAYASAPVKIQAGDEVRFFSISKDQYNELKIKLD
jgi:inhibitor of KinA